MHFSLSGFFHLLVVITSRICCIFQGMCDINYSGIQSFLFQGKVSLMSLAVKYDYQLQFICRTTYFCLCKRRTKAEERDEKR